MLLPDVLFAEGVMQCGPVEMLKVLPRDTMMRLAMRLGWMFPCLSGTAKRIADPLQKFHHRGNVHR